MPSFTTLYTLDAYFSKNIFKNLFLFSDFNTFKIIPAKYNNFLKLVANNFSRNIYNNGMTNSTNIDRNIFNNNKFN